MEPTENISEETRDDLLLQRLFKLSSKHLETRWELFSLRAAERTSAALSKLAGAIMIIVFSMSALLFFSLGFAWWLGDLIHNRAGGFALTGLLFFLLLALFYRFVKPFVRDKVIQAILINEETTVQKNDHEKPS